MRLSLAAAGLPTLPRFCAGDGDVIGIGLHDAIGDFIRG
jgi:hypothetical protein